MRKAKGCYVWYVKRIFQKTHQGRKTILMKYKTKPRNATAKKGEKQKVYVINGKKYF